MIYGFNPSARFLLAGLGHESVPVAADPRTAGSPQRSLEHRSTSDPIAFPHDNGSRQARPYGRAPGFWLEIPAPVRPGREGPRDPITGVEAVFP